MASNALAAQFRAGFDANEHRTRLAERYRDVVCSFATASALTNETIKLVKHGMPKLRPLAVRAGIDPKLLKRLDNLIAGKHRACRLLKRARNKLVFHWDRALIRRAVRDYGRNERLVWLEADAEFSPVHRLAHEVLAHALFPDAGNLRDPVEQKRIIDEAMGQVDEVMRLIGEFFIACTYGFMLSRGVVRRTIDAAST